MKPFSYSGELRINEGFSSMEITPEAGQRGMSLWDAKFDLDASSRVSAVLKDFDTGKQSCPMPT